MTANTQLAEELRGLARGVVRTDEPMAKHTSFRIGGPADIYVEPAGADDLAAIMAWVNTKGLPWCVLGDGANVLVSDRGIRGVVIRMGRPFTRIKLEGERLVAGSAAKLDKLVTLTTNAGLGGLECAAAIPGTIGGAIVMNAGTHLGQIGEVVELVTVVTHEGRQMTLAKEELQLRYRWSVFQADRSKIIVEAALRLRPGNREELVRTAESIRRRRNINLPVGYSAGCIFKNPGGQQSAGQLIEMAGLKGARVGGAVVAEKHANFIVNEGNARAAEVRELAEKVRRTVKARSGVELEYEVRLMGDW